MSRTAILVPFLLAASAGCYHATVDTGRPPGGQTIEKPWAHSFIAGLVPPSAVETASRCPNGVARVDTQLSFLNMLANLVTLGIYSPMTITVQCAGGGSDAVPADGAGVVRAGEGGAAAALDEAARMSARTGEPVWVHLE